MSGWNASDIPDQTRTHRRGHRSQQRHRTRHGPGAGPPRRAGDSRVPQRGPRQARPRRTSGAKCRARRWSSAAGPGGPVLRTGVRGQLPVRAPRSAHQQRRCDGPAVREDRRRLRDAVRRQPPRALRADRAAAAEAAGHAGRAGGERVQLDARPGQHRHGRSQQRARATAVGSPTPAPRRRTCSSCTSWPGGCGRPAPRSSRPPPTPATRPPTCRPRARGWRAARTAERIMRGRQPDRRAVRRVGRAADAVRGHRAGRAARLFHRPEARAGAARPRPSWRAKWTRNDAAGERLWVASEQLTAVTYEGLKA